MSQPTLLTPRTALWRHIGVFVAGVLMAFALVWMLTSWRADAAPAPGESTIVALDEPCRAIDTRPEFLVGPRDAPLGADETWTFVSYGAIGNCEIPKEATGIVANVTAIDATLPTNVRLFPAGGTLPLVSNLNPGPGQPPVPNTVNVGLSAGGELSIYNYQGEVDLVVDISAYTTDTTISEMAAQIAELQALLEGVTRETVNGNDTLRLSGANFQVVDGSGDTGGFTNGVGNLIVGYDADDGGDVKTGSHNLIVGDSHTYLGFGGVVFGRNNIIVNESTSVTGGSNNTASGFQAVVTGGTFNTASGFQAMVTGGNSNEASGNWSTVTGGGDNTSSHPWSSVSGGRHNIAAGSAASVLGGGGPDATDGNEASGTYAAVVGGQANTAASTAAVGVGGVDNVTGGSRSVVLGGTQNLILSGGETHIGGDSLPCDVDDVNQNVACGEFSDDPAAPDLFGPED